jgi:hypothetical protein
VGANDGQRRREVGRLGLEPRDDGRLRKGVRKVLERDASVEWRMFDNLEAEENVRLGCNRLIQQLQASRVQTLAISS